MARKFDGSWGKRVSGGAGTLGSMALALGLAGLPAQVAAQQLIQNGGFEIVPTGTTQSYQINNSSTASSSLSIPQNLVDWSTGTTTTGAINCLVYGGINNMCGTGYLNSGVSATFWVFPGVSPNGGNFVGGDSAATYAGAISQSVGGLVIGKTYNLTFYQAGAQQHGFSGSTTDQWQVTFGSSPNQDSTLMHVATESDVAWNSQSMLFTASATTETLTFLALGTPNSEPPFALLDGVSLIQVPEPASIALLGFGIAGVAGLRRRRARATIQTGAGPPGAGPPGAATG